MSFKNAIIDQLVITQLGYAISDVMYCFNSANGVDQHVNI